MEILNTKSMICSLIVWINLLRVANCFCDCFLSSGFVLTVYCSSMVTQLTSVHGLFEQLCDHKVTSAEFYTANTTDLELHVSALGSMSIPAGLLAGFWLKALDLSNNYLSSFSSQMLEGVLGIDGLNLGVNRVQSLEWLSENELLTNLTTLTLDYNQIRSLKGIEKLRGLEKLVVSKNGLRSISELENLTNLEVLDARFNKIESAEALRNLKKLRVVKLSSNHLRSIDSFRNLDSLSIVQIQDNQLTSIESLSNKTQLEILWIYWNPIQSIKALSNSHLLKELHASNCGIDDISSLRLSVHLITIDLSFNSIRSISAMRNMTRLQELYLSNNQIESLSGLENTNNLDIIMIENNKVKTLKELKGNWHLRDLRASNNQLNDLLGLECTLDLQYLYLSNNNLTSLEAITNLTRLKFLYVDSNQLNSTQHLERLTQLEYLIMGNNPIGQLGEFSRHKKLQLLDIENTGIKSLDGLYNIAANFWSFRAGYNRLSNVDDFIKRAFRLKVFDVNHNNISSINWKLLDALYSLDELYLGGNLISAIEKDAIKNKSILWGLDLSMNKIEGLDGPIFRNLESLKKVWLDISNSWSLNSTCNYIESVRRCNKLMRINHRDYRMAVFTRTRFRLDCEIRLLFLGFNLLVNMEFEEDVDRFLLDCQDMRYLRKLECSN